MAGTATVTAAGVGNGTERFIRYTIAWVATAGGAVSANPFTVAAGYVTQARFNTGSPAPTTLYDVTVVDTGSVDVLGGQGADITVSGAIDVVKTLTVPFYQDGSRQLDLVVANAGAGGAGTITLMIRTPVAK